MMPPPKIHVLLVDDEIPLLEVSKEFLERDPDISADTESSPKNVLKLLELHDYDVIVSDYQMPAMDGIQLLKEVRASGNSIPFILFTGRGREEVVIEALNAGADYYLQKGGQNSSQFAELINMIRQVNSNQRRGLALRISEERYRSLFENSVDAVMLTTIDFDTVLSANPSACAMFGMSEDEIKKTGIRALISDEKAWGDTLERLNQTGVVMGEFAYKRKDGASFIGETTHAILTGHYGQARISMIVRDVGKRKLAEEVLFESASRLRTYMDNAPEGIFVIDESGNYRDANKTACTMLNYSREELLELNIADIADKNTIHESLEKFQELQKKGSITLETILIRKDGTGLPVFINAVELPDRRFMAFCTDITERKRDQTALRESEKKYRLLVDSALEAIVVVQDGVPRLVNPISITLTGYSAKELTSKPFSSLIHPDDQTMVMERYKKRTNREVVPDRYEFRLMSKDRGTRWVELKAVLIEWEGRPATLNFMADITERKLADEERERIRCWRAGVNNILESVLAPLSLDQKLKSITDGVVKTFNADFCRIWLIESGDLCDKGCVHAKITEGPNSCQLRDRCLHLRSSSGRYTHLDGEGHRRVPFNAYKIGRIAAGKEAKFLTNDAEHDPRVHDHEWAKSLGLVAFSGYRLRPPNGDVLGVFALFTKFPISPDMDALLEGLSRTISLVIQKDIADRLLFERERDIRTMIEQSPLSIQVMSTDGRTVQVNHAFEDLWGLSLEDLKDYNVLSDEQYIRLGTMPFIKKGFSGEATTVPPMQYDSHAISDLGRKKWVEGEIYPIRNELGVIQNVIMMHQDITERKMAEDGLRMASKKLNLLSSITRHDINNQLTVLLGNLSFAEKKLSDASSNAHLQKAEAAAKRISEMIQFTKNYEDIGLNAPLWHNVRASIDTGASSVALGSVKLVNAVPDDLEIFADPLITKVFHNLVDNAVRHGGKITTIRCSIEENENLITIICEDDGVGITEEIKKDLFIRRLEGDHGLGLFLSREILHITDITITEDGEPGRGARFKITALKSCWRRSQEQIMI